MPETPDTWDSTDRQIAAVLQISGRASWGAVSRLLDLPERTIARRGQRLIDRGAVKVSTYLDVRSIQESRSIVIRMRVSADRVRPVAAEVARRADASSVSVLEGARQIVALLILPDPSKIAQVVLDELPAIEGVLSCEAMTVLRWYRSGYDWMMTNTISPEVRAAAQAEIHAALDEDAAPVTDLTEQDQQLIELLAEEGRMPATRLADLIGAKTAVVRRRVEQLIASGTLRVRAEVAPGVFGLRIEAMVWLRVPPGQIDEMGRILAASGEVRFCSAVTGEYQMMVDMLARSEEQLLEFLSGAVSRVPGARVGEVDLVLAPVRRGPLTMIDED